MSTYYAAEDAMLKNYWKRIGNALSRGVKVFDDRGELLSAGELSDQIWMHDHPGQLRWPDYPEYGPHGKVVYFKEPLYFKD